MRWLPWRRHPKPPDPEALDQARYDMAKAQADKLRDRVNNIDDWTRRVKGTFT